MSTKIATKIMYKNALLELSKKQPLCKITVKTIIDYTESAKQTFYNHFDDKFDLINYVLLDFVENIEKTYAMHTYHGILSVLDYCIDNKKFFAAIAKDTCQNNFREFFYHWCVNYYINAMKDDYPEELSESLLLAFQFYCHGAVGIFIDWLISGSTIPKTKIAETIVKSRPVSIAYFFPIDNSL